MGLENDSNTQYEIFDDYYNEQKRLEPLMQVFDQLNERYGRGTVKLATASIVRHYYLYPYYFEK